MNSKHTSDLSKKNSPKPIDLKKETLKSTSDEEKFLEAQRAGHPTPDRAPEDEVQALKRYFGGLNREPAPHEVKNFLAGYDREIF